MKLIVKVILNFVIALIDGITSPLANLITNNLPSVNNALQMINNFLTWLKDFVLWVLSWLPFSTTFWTFFISVLVLSITLPVLIDMIKLVVKWWHALAP